MFLDVQQSIMINVTCRHGANKIMGIAVIKYLIAQKNKQSSRISSSAVGNTCHHALDCLSTEG